MKKLIIAGMLLSISCVGQAMEKSDTKKTITLPSASVLEKRLKAGGFDHFLEKTRLHKKLGGQKKYVEGVAMAVELALYDYAKDLGSPMMSMMMQMRKPQLFESLLKDSPEALKQIIEFNKKVEKS